MQFTITGPCAEYASFFTHLKNCNSFKDLVVEFGVR